MTSSFKALDSIIIKDDFYSNPDSIRNLALNKSYREPPAGTSQLAVTAICNELESKAMYDRLQSYLPQDKENRIVRANILFRYTLAEIQKKVFCHVDGCSYAGILYLTKPEDCAGGTSLYRHKPSGDEIYNRENRHLYDFQDPSQWEVITDVEMVYNRLVIYPGQLFHAITPVFFGDSIANARLTQNIFVYREQDKDLM